MERMTVEHGFGPFYRADSRLLILGSFPSVKSREAQFFYGHPQNRFWPLMARLCGEERPLSLADKADFLARNHIALYDVIEQCSIVGSSDSSIRDVEPAELRPILAHSEIGGHIFTNGATASRLYRRYLFPLLGIEATALPSTSPANAACSLDILEARWGAVLLPILRRKTYMNIFLCYDRCSTCQKAERWLQAQGVAYEKRPIKEQNPSAEELKLWQARSGLPLKRFVNTSGMLYRELQLKDRLPEMSEEEVFALLATDGMLVKRPILITDSAVLPGFKEQDWAAALSI